MGEEFKGLGERISIKLKQYDKKQKDFAKEVDISPTAISNYINGNRVPETACLYQIATALGTSMEWLLTGDENLTTENIETCLSSDEQKLIDEFRLLTGRDQEEVLWFARMKVRRENMGNNHGSLTLKDGDGGMEGDDGSNATA